jgi:hypothetical protein
MSGDLARTDSALHAVDHGRNLRAILDNNIAFVIDLVCQILAGNLAGLAGTKLSRLWLACRNRCMRCEFPTA